MALTPWAQRLRDTVQSGPCPFDQVVQSMANLVPPSRAHRDSVGRSNWIRNARGAEKTEPTEAQKASLVYRGQHRIAYSTVWTQQRAGWVEVYEEDGVKMVGPGPKMKGD